MFSLAEESGDHQVRIWRNSNNTLVAGPIPWTFGGDEAWISLDIPDVAIEANTDSTISVSTGTGPKRDYANLAADVPVAGNNGLHLSYPPNAGVFNENLVDAMPFKSWNASTVTGPFQPVGPVQSE